MTYIKIIICLIIENIMDLVGWLLSKQLKFHCHCNIAEYTKLLNILYRHEIFPEFSGIPEFLRPQRSFSWKSQIRFNIYGGGGGGGWSISCMYFATQSLSIACIHHSLNQL